MAHLTWWWCSIPSIHSSHPPSTYSTTVLHPSLTCFERGLVRSALECVGEIFHLTRPKILFRPLDIFKWTCLRSKKATGAPLVSKWLRKQGLSYNLWCWDKSDLVPLLAVHHLSDTFLKEIALLHFRVFQNCSGNDQNMSLWPVHNLNGHQNLFDLFCWCMPMNKLFSKTLPEAQRTQALLL